LKRALAIVAVLTSRAVADEIPDTLGEEPAVESNEPTAFERGLTKFQAGDFAAAIEPLEQARAQDPSDADTALLLGIAYYRTDQLDRAKPLFEQAEHDGDADGKSSARIFLGLIADTAGHPEAAHQYFDQVARTSPALRSAARLLLDEAGVSRWSIVGIVRPGFDSNVALIPLTAQGRGKQSGSGDAELDLVGTLAARPVEDVPLVLDDTASYSAHAQLHDYDMLSDRVGAMYVWANKRDRASLGYHFEAATLGGERYVLGHAIDAGVRRRLCGTRAIAARYTFAARDYGAGYEDYTGLTHTGIVEIGFGSHAQPFELALGYAVEHEGTSDAMLTAFVHGPRAVVRIQLRKTVELRSLMLVTQRIYDNRQSGNVQNDTALYFDLSNTWGLLFGGSFLGNASTDKQDSYIKWTLFAGVIAVISS
jgi:tetratricopeptide (TPR) repeat protein